MQDWTTLIGVPPFDQIRDEHFRPAFDVALGRLREEIDAIRDETAAPTFANTVEALERSGQLLERVDGVFSNLNAAETNDTLQAIAQEVAPKQAAPPSPSGPARASRRPEREAEIAATRRTMSALKAGFRTGVPGQGEAGPESLD